MAIPIYIDAYLNIAKFDSLDGDMITLTEKPTNKKVLRIKIVIPEFVIFNRLKTNINIVPAMTFESAIKYLAELKPNTLGNVGTPANL